MTKEELFSNIKRKSSFLCIGLDPDMDKLPEHLLAEEDPIFEFNKQIIDATHDLCVCYKPNMAFYETLGVAGWISLEKTIRYLKGNYPDQFTIADAKRGDIGNTSKMYAKAFLENLDFDAITVAPYMGEDSVTPFLGHKDKWVILLALTSNKGAENFQKSRIMRIKEMVKAEKEKELFKQILETSQEWGNAENMMYVVGATQAQMLTDIREIVPDHFLLVPGVGAQGGSLADVAKYGMNKQCGLLVNSSRGIIFAGEKKDFTDKARIEAKKLQEEMKGLLEKYL
jgi:orotidine-5'-phosphate decarboxylase